MAGRVGINTKAEVKGEDQPPNPQTVTVAVMDHISSTMFLTAVALSSDRVERGLSIVRRSFYCSPRRLWFFFFLFVFFWNGWVSRWRYKLQIAVV